VAAAAKTFETWSEAADCCGISAEKDDADQRAVNAKPPHRLVLSIALKENFNGDGAVVSYPNNVRRTNETIMKLRQWHCRLHSRTDLAVMMSPVAMATTL
jgi:hypothetical protein